MEDKNVNKIDWFKSKVIGLQDSLTSKSNDGLKSVRTTNVFRIVNFELYAKPNLIIMTFGAVAFICSGVYLAYMKSQMKVNNTYIAISDDGSEILMHRKSKWD